MGTKEGSSVRGAKGPPTYSKANDRSRWDKPENSKNQEKRVAKVSVKKKAPTASSVDVHKRKVRAGGPTDSKKPKVVLKRVMDEVRDISHFFSFSELTLKIDFFPIF